jgi:hypothetical protein
MGTLYLVRDGDRIIWLANEHNDRLYVYVANLGTFVLNPPLSVDFLIDRAQTYEAVDAARAAEIMAAGRIGKIDPRSNRWLLEHFRAEPSQLDSTEVLRAQGQQR